MRASDIMEKGVVTVSPELLLAEFEELLSGEDISGAPVVDGRGRVVGVATKTDIVRALSEKVPNVFDLGPDLTVGDVMTADAVCVRPDADLTEVARVMVDGGLHRVLVADRERLVGIISALDVLRAVASRLES